jgi:hypothetical protein
VYRRRLQVQPQAREHVMRLDAARSIEDMAELKRTVPILIATILVFFAHQRCTWNQPPWRSAARA